MKNAYFCLVKISSLASEAVLFYLLVLSTGSVHRCSDFMLTALRSVARKCDAVNASQVQRSSRDLWLPASTGGP